MATMAGPDWRMAFVNGLVAVVGFHLAQWVWGGWIVLFLYGVVRLSELGSWRKAFYTTLAVGYGAYAPHLLFLWTIFEGAAVVLWGILAVWLALFVVLVRGVRRRWGPGMTVLLVPWLWLGVEYFRSELYYLRFSWLSAGYAFAGMPGVLRFAGLGVYGTGFLVAGLAGWAAWMSGGRIIAVLFSGMLVMFAVDRLPVGRDADDGGRRLEVAGVQMEFPWVGEVTPALDEVVRRHPGVDLIVLSEYTFLGPVPDEVLAWCKREGRYLVVGGQDPIDEKRYFNTAFVIGPEGEIVFQQVKSVPIQFFKDGEPAASRAVWESPWGRLGIAICYDLSYRRVIDELVRGGAEGLIIPVMDVAEWGLRQRELHGRVGPVRAAEYGIPIFRLCSSGISQVIDRDGRIGASGSYPGVKEIIAGELRLAGGGEVPWDAWLGPMGVAVVAGLGIGLGMGRKVTKVFRSERWLVDGAFLPTSSLQEGSGTAAGDGQGSGETDTN